MQDAQLPKRYLLLFVAFFAALFVSTFNSFGLSTLQDVDIARRLSALTSVIYDPGPAPRRDNVVVVVFDDDAVEGLSADPNDPDRPLRTLGPSYADQRAVIAAAQAAGAAAVFLDITYARDVESDISARLLAGTARSAMAAGMPVLFGPIGAQTPLGRRAEGLTSVDVAWEFSREDDYQLRGVRGRPNAAVAAYQAACAQKARLRQPITCAPLPENASPMILTWGRGAHPDLPRYWDAESIRFCRPRATLWEGLRGAVGDMARDLFRAEPTMRRQKREIDRCTFHLAVSGRVVVEAQRNPEAAAALRELLGGRVVMMGAAMRGSSDFVDTPSGSRLPGVFQHAMALDNLMVMGAAYKHTPPDVFLALDVGDVAELGLTIMIAFLVGALMQWPPGTSRLMIGLRIAGAVGGALAIAVSSAAVAYLALNWTPGDVIGVFGSGLAAFGVAQKEPWENITKGDLPVRAAVIVVFVLGAAPLLLWLSLTTLRTLS